MTDISYNEWSSMSDDALLKHIGSFIKHKRIEQNITQHDLSEKAGISRSTLSLFENGQSANLSTLIQLLRILEQLHLLDVFSIQTQISPLEMAQKQKEKRQRARGTKNNQSDQSQW